jgi:hypothetical protein
VPVLLRLYLWLVVVVLLLGRVGLELLDGWDYLLG